MINTSIPCDWLRSTTVISLSSVDVADTALVYVRLTLRACAANSLRSSFASWPTPRVLLICAMEERVSLIGERVKKARGLEESFSLCLRERLASMIPHPPPPLCLFYNSAPDHRVHWDTSTVIPYKSNMLNFCFHFEAKVKAPLPHEIGFVWQASLSVSEKGAPASAVHVCIFSVVHL